MFGSARFVYEVNSVARCMSLPGFPDLLNPLVEMLHGEAPDFQEKAEIFREADEALVAEVARRYQEARCR